MKRTDEGKNKMLYMRVASLYYIGKLDPNHNMRKKDEKNLHQITMGEKKETEREDQSNDSNWESERERENSKKFAEMEKM